MDPQQEIATYLRSKGVQQAVLKDMLNRFAHDLAEAQREFMRTGVLSMDELIDHIDPEAQRGE